MMDAQSTMPELNNYVNSYKIRKTLTAGTKECYLKIFSSSPKPNFDAINKRVLLNFAILRQFYLGTMSKIPIFMQPNNLTILAPFVQNPFIQK